MKGHELKIGDVFTVVGHVDPESPVRVCISEGSNDVMGLRFGFPNKPGFWCHMGVMCDVELASK